MLTARVQAPGRLLLRMKATQGGVIDGPSRVPDRPSERGERQPQQSSREGVGEGPAGLVRTDPFRPGRAPLATPPASLIHLCWVLIYTYLV